MSNFKVLGCVEVALKGGGWWVVGGWVAGLEKVLYPGILVTSQFQIWQPILGLAMAKLATLGGELANHLQIHSNRKQKMDNLWLK